MPYRLAIAHCLYYTTTWLLWLLHASTALRWIQGFEPWASRATIWRANQLRYTHRKTCPKGFEPPTHGLEGRCSIQLSYGHKESYKGMTKRVMGIEPTYLAWKAGVLPLNYTRISYSRGDRIRTCGLLVPNQAL